MLFKNFFLVGIVLVSLGFASISPETLHLEDAEQVEAFLVAQDIPSNTFQVLIASENESTSYIILWPTVLRADVDGEDLMISIMVHKISAEAVATAVSRSNWEPDFLLLVFADCWTATPIKVVQDYMFALDYPNEMDALAILSSGTRVFYESPEFQEGDQN